MDTQKLLTRVNATLKKGTETFASATKDSGGFGFKFMDAQLLSEFRAMGISLLTDLYHEKHQFCVDFLAATRDSGTPSDVKKGIGIITVVRNQVTEGLLQSTRGLIAAELFADFLDMAQHLVDEGYKDAAAVIAGSSLEAHLKRLCQRNGILVETLNARNVMVPKKADTLNAELAAANLYGKSEQKQVTAWLGIRNDAAHGNYSKVIRDVVVLMVAGIRDFIVRHPA